jgi:hypothetical protein
VSVWEPSSQDKETRIADRDRYRYRERERPQERMKEERNKVPEERKRDSIKYFIE